MDLEFTGERYVPGAAGVEDLYGEHMSRYVAAGRLAGAGAVLDVGCGCGYGAAYLASCRATRVLGVDVSPAAIQFAAAHYRAPNLNFAVMDAARLGVGPGFRLVTCFEMIEHVAGAEQVLAEVSRVLADDGVLLVSTPNKATYVAGGPSGRNPFHVREYVLDEFRDLLRSVFPRVSMLTQDWCEGLLIDRAGGGMVREPGSTPVELIPLPREGGPPARHDTQSAPAFFIAVCGKTAEAERAAGDLPVMLVDARSARYRTLKGQVRAIESELDSRAAWAARLRADIEARDKTIRKLQDDLAALHKSHDERGRWAKGMERDLEIARARLREIELAVHPGGATLGGPRS